VVVRSEKASVCIKNYDMEKTTQTISHQRFGGERPLFGLRRALIDDIEITDGESGIKHCADIVCRNSRFYGKYPWWHVDGSVIEDCYFAPGSRSAIWYSDRMEMRRCVIDGPKFFREMHNLAIEDTEITDADETFWNVTGLKARRLKLHDGTYPFMGCRDVDVDGLESDSKYVFQYVKNAVIRNARIVTKDSFWETENVTVYDSLLDGEYLGWHSKNLRLVRCHIAGEQPLCYADGLVLEDCTFDPACDRAFEYSSVEATISGHIENIKNPATGHITADTIGSVTIDEHILKPADCVIKARTEER